MSAEAHRVSISIAVDEEEVDETRSSRLSLRRTSLTDIRLSLAVARMRHEKVIYDCMSALPAYVRAEPSDASCAICLDLFQKGDVVKVLRCNHEYHEHCLHDWCVVRPTCPLCRMSMLDELLSS